MDDDASEWVDAPPTPVPASGAWRPGDHSGERKFLRIGDLPLEADPIGRLPDVVLAYETWGELNDARDNAIYVSHALSGDSHAYGHAGPGVEPAWVVHQNAAAPCQDSGVRGVPGHAQSRNGAAHGQAISHNPGLRPPQATR